MRPGQAAGGHDERLRAAAALDLGGAVGLGARPGGCEPRARLGGGGGRRRDGGRLVRVADDDRDAEDGEGGDRDRDEPGDRRERPARRALLGHRRESGEARRGGAAEAVGGRTRPGACAGVLGEVALGALGGGGLGLAQQPVGDLRAAIVGDGRGGGAQGRDGVAGAGPDGVDVEAQRAGDARVGTAAAQDEVQHGLLIGGEMRRRGHGCRTVRPRCAAVTRCTRAFSRRSGS